METRLANLAGQPPPDPRIRLERVVDDAATEHRGAHAAGGLGPDPSGAQGAGRRGPCLPLDLRPKVYVVLATFGAVALLFLLLAVVACAGPALRAARENPQEVLGCE